MKPALPSIGLLWLLLSCSGNKTETAATTIDTAAATAATDNQIASTSVEEEPVDTTGFSEFIGLFRAPETELNEVALKFIGEPNYGDLQYTTVALLETDPVYLVLYVKVTYSTGSRLLTGVTIGKDGIIISNVELAEGIPAGEPYGESQGYSYDYKSDRKAIFVSRRAHRWDEQKQEGYDIESVNPFYLDKDGNIEAGRDYLEVSEETLDIADLRNISKEDLKIMRNEVFAAYGYIFKTEPLKSHFEAKPWYKGERDNVDDLLTDREKANIALIKQVESSK